jgi:DNA-binding NarL/FixJ family response regulator
VPERSEMKDGARTNSETPFVSVLIGHRHKLVRAGIACMLEVSGFDVKGDAGDFGTLQELATEHDADILILHNELPGYSPEAIRTLLAAVPISTVVALAEPDEPQSLSNDMSAGAMGYLSLGLSAEEFVQSLRLLSKGSIVVSGDMADDAKEKMGSVPAERPEDDLSNREKEVLDLVARGSTNREIAKELTVTENTIKAHLRRILEKLNLRNRQQAVAFAVREGLTDDTRSKDPS